MDLGFRIGYRQETGEAWGEWSVSDISTEKQLRLSSVSGIYPAVIKVCALSATAFGTLS